MNTNPNQTDANERHELARMLPELVERELTSDRQYQLQEFVMNEINDPQNQKAPRRAPQRRIVFAATALAGVAAVTAVAIGTGAFGIGQNPGTGPDASSGTELTPVAATFEAAAGYAAALSFDDPDSDQWIYVKTQSLNTGSVANDKGMQPDVVHQEWYSADGTQMAWIDPETGKFQTWEQENEYPFLSTLPTDPEELLSVLRDDLAEDPADSEGEPVSAKPTDEGKDEDASLFGKVVQIFDDHLLPPDVTAALWQATALIPGVTEMETIEVDGREVIAVGRIQDGWRFEQLLVDPETFEFVGVRSEAAEDYTFEGNGGDPIDIKKGEIQFETIRLDAAIVDKAGETS